MEKTYDFFVMGDINLDWYCPEWLPIALTEIDQNGINIYSPIEERPGGSALNFAVFLREKGFYPLLFGKSGEDTAIEFIKKFLLSKGIDFKIINDPAWATGKVFIGRDKNGVRFLINERRNANHQLDEASLTKNADLLRASRMLYISGYCFMYHDSKRTNATLKAIEIASESDVSIVLDVVPHQFYKYYKGDFWQLISNMYLFISEVATVRRYIGKRETGEWGDKHEQIDEEVAMQTAEILRNKYGYQNFILRYGPTGCDNQIVCSPSKGITISGRNLHSKKIEDTRGLGDKLAIDALINFFNFTPLNSPL